MLTAIRQWVIRTMMKAKGETGIVQTMPKKEIVEMNTQITAQRLMQNGVDPNSLKNADQVENAIIAIENRSNVQQGITSTKSADVFDLKGKKIKDTDNIMGGEELPPPGSRGGPDDIAAPFQSAEESIKDMIEAENKKNISKMRERKNREDVYGIEDYDTTNMSEIKQEIIKTETQLGNLNPDDPDFREKAKPLIDKITALQKKLRDDKATGGRIGYKLGSFKTILNFLNENNPVQAYQKYLKSVKTRAQENPKALVPELAAITSGGIFVNRRMQDILKNMKEKDMENNLENFRKELNKDPFYQKYPDIKDKVLENYTEKMFGEKRAAGGRIGYFMGGPNPRGLGLLRQILNYMSKKGKETGGFKGADLSGLDMLRLSNPKALNKMLEDVRGKVNIREGIMGTDTVRAQQQALREQRKGLTEKSLDVAKAMKDDQDRIAKRIDVEAKKTIIPEVKRKLIEDMGMSEDVAQKMAENMAEAAKNIKPLNAPPEITDEGLLQLENVLKNMETGGKKKRDLNADGGRIGFKDGMTRRTFLKLLGGAMSIPIIGKVLAPLKLAKGVTKVPIIKTDNVPGKPEWFDALVNKVIIEGDDVTKKFATKEREIVHAKEIDKDNYVVVTQDLDEGVVRVEYDNPQATMFGEKVDLTYKKPPPDEGNPRPVGEFQTSETGMVGRTQGPDDYEIEVEGTSGRFIEDLESDVSKLKEYATGKKLTMKEILEAKKRKDKVKYYETPEGQSQYVIERQGEYDYSPDDGMASGGIARMLGE